MKPLEKGIKAIPDDDFLKIVKFVLLVKQNKTKEAEQTLLQIKDEETLIQSWKIINNYIITEKKPDLIDHLVPLQISYTSNSGFENLPDSLTYHINAIMVYLYATKDHDRLEKLIADTKSVEFDAVLQRQLLFLLIDFSEYDRAFDLLEEMIDQDIMIYPQLASDEGWPELRELERWSQIKEKAKQKWDNEKDNREAKYLSKRGNKLAEDWILEDFAGEKVSLNSFKGDIVILYFCNSKDRFIEFDLKDLNNWFIKEKHLNTHVLAVSVKEYDINFPKKMFEEYNLAIKGLIGNNELVIDYEITKLPYTCVIDKEGKIAFTSEEVAPDYIDMLDAWVNYL
ncbi:redoxin domain-containing protein, partial [bacterium]|nr:redoxin domain-containing protein [bacterium]